jgi:tubulin polyglutamylase TTLL5
MSRGRGISLINKLEEVVFSEPIVMQKYIHNPFLLDGYKFDLRIYVLVTSINPLECFIYKEGFARVSTERYCNDVEEINNKFVHLTNYSIQKDSAKFPDMFTEK